ncbi:MAG: hypothetical protein WCI27_02510, partial [Candidatus Omnitrophota bacterium]
MINDFSASKILPLLAIFIFLSTFAQAVDVPTQQQAGGIEARHSLEEKNLKLKEMIQTSRATAPVEAAVPAKNVMVPDEEKVFTASIEVSGATRIPAAAIRAIVAGYEGKRI